MLSDAPGVAIIPQAAPPVWDSFVVSRNLQYCMRNASSNRSQTALSRPSTIILHNRKASGALFRCVKMACIEVVVVGAGVDFERGCEVEATRQINLRITTFCRTNTPWLQFFLFLRQKIFCQHCYLVALLAMPTSRWITVHHARTSSIVNNRTKRTKTDLTEPQDPRDRHIVNILGDAISLASQTATRGQASLATTASVIAKQWKNLVARSLWKRTKKRPLHQGVSQKIGPVFTAENVERGYNGIEVD